MLKPEELKTSYTCGCSFEVKYKTLKHRLIHDLPRVLIDYLWLEDKHTPEEIAAHMAKQLLQDL